VVKSHLTSKQRGAGRAQAEAPWSGAGFPAARHGEQLIAALAACPPDDPGRPALRQRTIEAWLPLAYYLARRYRGRGEPVGDLVQVAVVGLIESIDRFEIGRGTGFMTYAIPSVLGELKRHFRDHSWSMRVPRRAQEVWLSIRGATDALTQDLGRTPTAPDLASRLGVGADQVLEGLQAARVYRPASLSAPANDGDGEIGDLLGACDYGFELTELRMALRAALTKLSERERIMLGLRFYEDLTQQQIATRFGISQMHVSRLLVTTLLRLRHLILEAD